MAKETDIEKRIKESKKKKYERKDRPKRDDQTQQALDDIRTGREVEPMKGLKAIKGTRRGIYITKARKKKVIKLYILGMSKKQIRDETGIELRIISDILTSHPEMYAEIAEEIDVKSGLNNLLKQMERPIENVCVKGFHVISTMMDDIFDRAVTPEFDEEGNELPKKFTDRDTKDTIAFLKASLPIVERIEDLKHKSLQFQATMAFKEKELEARIFNNEANDEHNGTLLGISKFIENAKKAEKLDDNEPKKENVKLQ